MKTNTIGIAISYNFGRNDLLIRISNMHFVEVIYNIITFISR